MKTPPFLQGAGEGTLLDLHVQPRASRDEIAGLHGPFLKVRLKAPPAEGEANTACVKFIAHLLGVAKSEVEIVQGRSSRRKRLLVRGISPKDVQLRLEEAGVFPSSVRS
ncbi:MAG: YggU family protein [Deltaproteobacteria bacterium]|nr:YggU family protein [Deltaproteobacteria bacterium]